MKQKINNWNHGIGLSESHSNDAHRLLKTLSVNYRRLLFIYLKKNSLFFFFWIFIYIIQFEFVCHFCFWRLVAIINYLLLNTSIWRGKEGQESRSRREKEIITESRTKPAYPCTNAIHNYSIHNIALSIVRQKCGKPYHCRVNEIERIHIYIANGGCVDWDWE